MIILNSLLSFDDNAREKFFRVLSENNISNDDNTFITDFVDADNFTICIKLLNNEPFHYKVIKIKNGKCCYKIIAL